MPLRSPIHAGVRRGPGVWVASSVTRPSLPIEPIGMPPSYGGRQGYLRVVQDEELPPVWNCSRIIDRPPLKLPDGKRIVCGSAPNSSAANAAP